MQLIQLLIKRLDVSPGGEAAASVEREPGETPLFPMSGRSLRLLEEATFMDVSSGRNNRSLSGSKTILRVCGSEVIRAISS